MKVQYRPDNDTFTKYETPIAKGNNLGQVEVSAFPAPVPLGGESHYQSAGPSGFEVEANVVANRVSLMKLYVGIPATLAAGPYYVVVVDKAVALANGDLSILPTPKLSAGGEIFFWEPPGGAVFYNGIRVALSSTPVVYTSVAEKCSVSAWYVTI